MADPSADPAALAAFLKEAAYYIRAEQIFFSALYAVCLWDWLTSLKREWNLIWKTPWSVIKVLYILCRYWVIAVMPVVLWIFIEDHSEAECQKLFRVAVSIAMWNQLWAEFVLIVRTYAFLGNKKPVLYALCTIMAGIVGYQIWVDFTKMGLLPFLNPAVGGPCFPTVTYPGSPHIMIFFLLPLIFDTIVSILTVHRALQLRAQTGGRAGSPLLKTFVSEGLYYFFIISAANLANAIFYWQPKAVMSALLIPMSVVFPDILACRMILGLRERGVRHTSGGAVNSTHNYSHTARKLSTANKLNMGGPMKPTSMSPGAHAAHTAGGGDNKVGVVTDMGFNHELTTFSRTHHAAGGDSESMVGRDVKTVPYEMEDIDEERARNGIRVDIESHRYYEERSDGEDDKKGQSFMP